MAYFAKNDVLILNIYWHYLHNTSGTVMAHTYNNVDWVAFAQDCRLYLTKETPSRRGQPLGAPPITHFKSAGERPLPSINSLIDSKPIFTNDEDQCGVRNMASILEEALSHDRFKKPVSPTDVLISPASHDNIQLQFARDYVPLCGNGSECVANLIEGAPGPLGIYLSLAEQKELGPNRRFSSARLCILCIRRQCAQIKVAAEMVGCPNIALYIPPPFGNLFNCTEGYRQEFMGARIPTAERGDILVAGISADMYVTRKEGKFCIDQSCMVYDETPR